MVIHWGGFVIDSSVGIFFWFDSIRPIGYLFCGLFNLMNSQMFAIGMFPFVMLVVLPIYSSPNWPVRVLEWLRNSFGSWKLAFKQGFKKEKLGGEEQIKSNQKVSEANEKSENQLRKRKNSSNRKECYEKDRGKGTSEKGNRERTKFKEKIITSLLVIYMTFQLLLPFSHNITQGYNTWTEGIYGYSWDMMVHNWRIMDTKISVVVHPSDEELFLNTEKWSPNNRWTHHADVAKQFAACIARRLRNQFNLTDVSVYFDVWVSLNGRFAQRVYDPRVDILAAEWSPFKKPSWVMPVLSEFNDWRSQLREFEDKIVSSGENRSVVFMADFPGKNYVLSNNIGKI